MPNGLFFVAGFIALIIVIFLISEIFAYKKTMYTADGMLISPCFLPFGVYEVTEAGTDFLEVKLVKPEGAEREKKKLFGKEFTVLLPNSEYKTGQRLKLTGNTAFPEPKFYLEHNV